MRNKQTKSINFIIYFSFLLLSLLLLQTKITFAADSSAIKLDDNSVKLDLSLLDEGDKAKTLKAAASPNCISNINIFNSKIIHASSKQKDSQNNYYYKWEDPSSITLKNFIFSNFHWNRYSELYLSILVQIGDKNYLFDLKLTKNSMGKSITQTLSLSNYSKITVINPDSIASLSTPGYLAITKLDENKVPRFLGEVSIDTYVPLEQYNVQVHYENKTQAANTIYTLGGTTAVTKNSTDNKGSSNILNLKDSKLSNVNVLLDEVNVDNSKNISFTEVNLYKSRYDTFDGSRGDIIYTGDKKNIIKQVISKDLFNQFALGFNAKNGSENFYYCLETPQINTSNEGTYISTDASGNTVYTLKFGTKLYIRPSKTEIKASAKPQYVNIDIYDSYNNKLVYASMDNVCSTETPISGYVTFSNSKLPRQYFTDLSSIYVKVPNTPGTYTINITLCYKDAPISNIASGTITVAKK